VNAPPAPRVVTPAAATRSPGRAGAPEQLRSGEGRGEVTACDHDVSSGRRGSGAHAHVLWLRQLLGRAVLGPEGQHLGHVRDIVVRRTREGAGAVVRGVVVDAGGERFRVPVTAVREWQSALALSAVAPSVPEPYGRRPEELFLAADLLGRPVLAGAGGGHSLITDVALRRTGDGWAVGGVDTRGLIRRVLGSPRRLVDWETVVARRVLPTPPS
jgi:sporulation protein YlmC with PRC-barrel domain